LSQDLETRLRAQLARAEIELAEACLRKAPCEERICELRLKKAAVEDRLWAVEIGLRLAPLSRSTAIPA